MNINKKTTSSYVQLSLDGNLFGGPQSVQLCTAFKEILEEGTHTVVLDLTHLSWLSIAGTGILISALTSFRNKGGDVILVGASPEVKEQLEHARFDSIFDHYDQVNADFAAS